MRASLSTINYINSKYGNNENPLRAGQEELIRLATNRLGGLEGSLEYGPRFEGIVVARIVTCVDHENSDHLHVCMIDDGGVVDDVERDKDGLVQVVCGAPNARAGITVAWIPPGAAVPKSHDETELFVLGKREIRGVLSNGMLASPSELGISTNHEGILEINEAEVGAEATKPGTPFRALYGLDDVLLDFENKMFTHRPDCFGQIGLARELAGIQHLSYKSPSWYLQAKPLSHVSDLKVISKNEIPEKVPRFMLQVVDKIEVRDSPVWMQAYLTRVGIRPINGIVDTSNYYMHLTAQPTHAFDYDKVKAFCKGEVTVYPRMAHEGEKLTLLSGKEIELSSEDIVIATDTKAIALAGIMGGTETEVDESTTRIIIECATFDMYTIRRSSMRHGLFTDAVTRYTKGQSPLQNDKVLARMVSDLVDQYAAQPGNLYDSGEPEVMFMNSVEITPDFINTRLGTALSADEITAILTNVEMGVERSRDEIVVTPPFWRTDIEQKEDIVEEVGRLYGFDRLEKKLPLRSTKPAPRNELLDYKNTLRATLASAGANEVLSYSFVHGDTLKRFGIEKPEDWCYHIRNALSPDLQYYRPCLLPSILPKVRLNLKSDMVRGDDNEFALFEIGKVHVTVHKDDEGLPKEMERLAFVFAADEKTAARKYAGSAFYMAKQYLLACVDKPLKFIPLDSNDYPISAGYEKSRSALLSLDGQVFGIVGELRSSVKRAFKLPDFCAAFELDIELMKDYMGKNNYQQIGIYPKTQQDLTLAVPVKTQYADVLMNLQSSLNEISEKNNYRHTIMLRDIYHKPNSDNRNFTFRIWLWHSDKTLRTEEVNTLLDTLAASVVNDLNAKRV